MSSSSSCLPPNKKIRLSPSEEIQNTEPTLSPTTINNISSENTNQPETKPFNEKSYYVEKFEMKNANFEKYYKKQNIISDPDEWNLFIKTLQTELPTSFRFNPASKLHSVYKQRLLNDYYQLKKAEADNVVHEGISFKMPQPMPFYPNQMGWQCNYPKRFLNKHKQYFSPFREFLIECNENGIISRQETVSMIPVLFLSKYLSSDDIVLDMCAAPGNKTAQMLELLNYDLNGQYLAGKHKGFIIGNDADEKRAHIMVHQLKRLGINKFVVTNKLAQCIPRLKAFDGTDIAIDNILCDVPCSSDGTLRKSCDLWKKWTTAYGNGLHSVQLSILIHALHLVKPGGRVLYSTCSFNPIENEAVIASALLQLNHYYSKLDENGDVEVSVELVDCSKDLLELKRNKGLNEWYVWDKNMTDMYETYDDVANNRRKFVKMTMFNPVFRQKCQAIKDKVMQYLQLQRCMRFLPHFHDTGGFFVAVLHKKIIKKNKDKDKNKNEQSDELKDGGILDNEALFEIERREFDRRNVWNDNVPYFKMNKLQTYQVELAQLVTHFGLKIRDHNDNEEKKNENDDNDQVPYFDPNELLVRGLVNPRSLWFVPKSIANIIANPSNHHLRILQSGCRAFVRHDTKVTEHACKWRLGQDGCLFLSKYLTKQIVRLPIELFLMHCFLGKLEFEKVENLENGKYKPLVDDVMRKQTGGPIVISLHENAMSVMMNDAYKSLSGWKCYHRIDLMVKKHQILLLQTHLKNIYKDECVALNEKYDDINIEFDTNNRSQSNQIKNKKKREKFKKRTKKKRNRDWVHRNKDSNTNSNNTNNNNSAQ